MGGETLPKVNMAIPSESGSVVSYPIPPHQNEPIHSDYFKPSRFEIYSIALGRTTIVTSTSTLNYSTGQQVRLIIPSIYGSYQLNNVTGFVISLPTSKKVELDIDSSVNVNPFILFTPSIPITQAYEKAQILAIGDVRTGVVNANGPLDTGTFISGSFINISPQ